MGHDRDDTGGDSLHSQAAHVDLDGRRMLRATRETRLAIPIYRRAGGERCRRGAVGRKDSGRVGGPGTLGGEQLFQTRSERSLEEGWMVPYRGRGDDRRGRVWDGE